MYIENGLVGTSCQEVPIHARTEWCCQVQLSTFSFQKNISSVQFFFFKKNFSISLPYPIKIVHFFLAHIHPFKSSTTM